MSPLAERIAEIIGPSLDGMGYEIVQIQLIGGGRGQTLQIMADRLDGAAMTVDDCAEISRVVSALLDVDDPIDGAYTLEVSSPGIDRPLVRERDFERWAGFEAKIELSALRDGRRRFRGRLLGIENGVVRLRLGDESEEKQAKGAKGKSHAPAETGEEPAATVDIPFADIAKAKLVLTDDLLAAAAPPATE